LSNSEPQTAWETHRVSAFANTASDPVPLVGVCFGSGTAYRRPAEVPGLEGEGTRSEASRAASAYWTLGRISSSTASDRTAGKPVSHSLTASNRTWPVGAVGDAQSDPRPPGPQAPATPGDESGRVGADYSEKFQCDNVSDNTIAAVPDRGNRPSLRIIGRAHSGASGSPSIPTIGCFASAQVSAKAKPFLPPTLARYMA